MTNESLWLCIKSVAAVFEGSEDSAEKELEQLEAELLKLPEDDLATLRREFISIIGGLSRLEMRLAERLGR